MNTPEQRRPTILIVENDSDVVKSLALLLDRRGYACHIAMALAEAWLAVSDEAPDVILLDLNFTPGRTDGEEGLSFLKQIVDHDRRLVVVVLTGHSGVSIAVSAMRWGAYDFIVKPWSNERLIGTIKAAVQERERRLAALDEPASKLLDVLFLGESRAVSSLRSMVERVAPTEAAVLVTGPNGSGKSTVARLIHQLSRRSTGPLHIIDVGALERAEAEAMLREKFVEACGGTIILERLDDLPPFARAILSNTLTANAAKVRMIATAQSPSRLEGVDGPGNEILAKAACLQIHVPSLAARENDAVILARHFLRLFAARHGLPPKILSPRTEAYISQNHIQDEVRGLAVAMERAAILSDDEVVDLSHLQDAGAEASAAQGPSSRELSLAEVERATIEQALRRHSFNVSHAAAELGITRASLYRRMSKHGL